MAVAHNVKRVVDADFSNLGNPGNYSINLLQAALFPVSITGEILASNNEEGIFLLNPSSWEESKSAKWIQHEVPGQSDPVMQWVSSGARTLSFEALVTADTSYKSEHIKKIEAAKDKPKTATEFVADLASSLFKVQIPPKREFADDKLSVNLDISSNLNYYRSLMYPSYTGSEIPGRLIASPPLLALFAGSSISKIPYSDSITTSQDVWVLTDLKIRITKQLLNLSPMEALVTFSLVQYNIRSSDAAKFHNKNNSSED